MISRSFCMFCGSNADDGDHGYCRERLRLMALDMQRMEPWLVMQRAENGYYGSAPHRSAIDPTDWRPRARQLRESGLSWRRVARALADEGFKSKQGHQLDSVLILNGIKYQKKSG